MQHLPLTLQQAVPIGRHPIAGFALTGYLPDEPLGAQGSQGGIDAARRRAVVRCETALELAEQFVAALRSLGEKSEQDERKFTRHEELFSVRSTNSIVRNTNCQLPPWLSRECRVYLRGADYRRLATAS